jgi:hypothetical protein
MRRSGGAEQQTGIVDPTGRQDEDACRHLEPSLPGRDGVKLHHGVAGRVGLELRDPRPREDADVVRIA